MTRRPPERQPEVQDVIPLDMPIDLEDVTPPTTWRDASGGIVIAILLAIVLLAPSCGRAAERPKPPLQVTGECPAYDLSRGDTIVFRIESSADGKPAVKSCRVIKRVPPGKRGEKRRKAKVNA